MISKSAIFVLAIRVGIESINPCPNIHIPFSYQIQQNKEEIEPEKECQHKIQYLCEFYHSRILNILLGEVYQTYI